MSNALFRLRGGALAIAVALLLGACANPAAPPAPPTPSPSESVTPTPTEPSASPVTVEAFFAHLQPTRTTLTSERHTLTVGATDDPVAVAVAALVDGSLLPADPDYANLWAEGNARLLSTARDGATLLIDLELGGLQVGAEAESIAIAQLVWTAWAIDPTIAEVQFLVDGGSAETLAGHVDITMPIGREPAEAVLSPLQILSPAEGTSVMSPVVADGVACVFEAAFSWTLEGPDGSVVDGSAMAREACPARAAWTLELGALAPGDYVLTVIEHSAMDGSIVSTDSRAFTVVG